MEKDWDFINDLLNVYESSAEEIKRLFLSHQLDSNKVWGNYECFLRRHEGALMIAFNGIEKEKFITPSVKYFIHPQRISSEFPMWVIAAYPDVLVWYYTDLTIDKKLLIRNSQESLTKFLDNLVGQYKFIIKRELETGVKIE